MEIGFTVALVMMDGWTDGCLFLEVRSFFRGLNPSLTSVGYNDPRLVSLLDGFLCFA